MRTYGATRVHLVCPDFLTKKRMGVPFGTLGDMTPKK